MSLQRNALRSRISKALRVDRIDELTERLHCIDAKSGLHVGSDLDFGKSQRVADRRGERLQHRARKNGADLTQCEVLRGGARREATAARRLHALHRTKLLRSDQQTQDLLLAVRRLGG